MIWGRIILYCRPPPSGVGRPVTGYIGVNSDIDSSVRFLIFRYGRDIDRKEGEVNLTIFG